MINYTGAAIIKPFTEQEINEITCRLMAFCRINKGSFQVKKLEKALEDLEKSNAEGLFNK